jgi:hypothetical protein
MPRQNCSTNCDYRFRDGPFPRTRHRWLSSMLARAALRWAMVIARNITSGCGCAFQILLASQFVERFWLIWTPSLAPLRLSAASVSEIRSLALFAAARWCRPSASLRNNRGAISHTISLREGAPDPVEKPLQLLGLRFDWTLLAQFARHLPTRRQVGGVFNP